MRIHDHITILGMEGRVSKLLSDGKLEVVLSSVINSSKGPTNVVIVKPVMVYRICDYK